MADIMIKMGVNAPADQTKVVLQVLEHVFSQTPEKTAEPFEIQAYEEDFTDSAIGVMASMSFILKYHDQSMQEKTLTAPLLQAFQRMTINGKPALDFLISAQARNLLRIVYMQRDLEGNEKERFAFVQRQAEDIGLI